MTDDLEIPEISRWIRSAGLDQRPEERDEWVRLVLDFCASLGRTPTDVVAGCFRRDKDGDRAISVKARRAIQGDIDGFIEGRGLSGHAATMTGNRVRSFLIHNGVFIQGPVSTS